MQWVRPVRLPADVTVPGATAQGPRPIHFRGPGGVRTVAGDALSPHNLEADGSEHRKESSESHSSKLMAFFVL